MGTGMGLGNSGNVVLGLMLAGCFVMHTRIRTVALLPPLRPRMARSCC